MLFQLLFLPGFRDIYRVLVYRPQLNILYFLYELVGQDFGLAIILLAIILNLLILPIFAQSYINLQKQKILRPLISDIQKKYKQDPQKMIAKMRDFNQAHGIKNQFTFLVLFIQLFFLTGVFLVVRDTIDDKIDANLYSLFFDQTEASFENSEGKVLAFNQIPIGGPDGQSRDYIFLPILVGFLSFAYGYYVSKLAPSPKLPQKKLSKKELAKKKKEDEEKLFDPEAMQKSMEFNTTFVMPIFLAGIQLTLPVGLSIYMATTSLMSLLRQIGLTTYYSKHTDDLIAKIADSDPSSRDDDPYNNLEITAKPEQMTDLPQTTKIVDVQVEHDLTKKNSHTKQTSKKSKSKSKKKKKTK